MKKSFKDPYEDFINCFLFLVIYSRDVSYLGKNLNFKRGL